MSNLISNFYFSSKNIKKLVIKNYKCKIIKNINSKMLINLKSFNYIVNKMFIKKSISNTKSIHYLVEKYLPNATTSDLINLKDLNILEKNLKLRKMSGCLTKLKIILKELEFNQQLDETQRNSLTSKLIFQLWKLPNSTHPKVLSYGDKPHEIQKFNIPRNYNFNDKLMLTFSNIAKIINSYRMDHLSNFTGHKSYYLMDILAEMEHALIKYTLKHLKRGQFQLISVPDILPMEIIEGCGMKTTGERTQVYKIKSNGKCLSGTSEMALAGYFNNKIINEIDLPIKLSAVSRCFRAETSGLHEEKGIYRVHQFSKVEMFSVCTEDQSDEMLESFKHIEIELFKKLGILFKLLDMPASELGVPAYRKYDIEAWMPGRKLWGEISSCSNCTDYQAKRLNIKYINKNGEIKYCHTVNGTACAIPRILITLLETFQNENGTINIPVELRKYLGNKEKIVRKKILPELKLVKRIENK